MGLWNWIVNGVNAAVGRNREFEELINTNDISRALSLMTDNAAKVNDALKVYDINEHSVMKRPDKVIFGKKDPLTGKRKFLRWEEKWKIPIPYPVYINEIALVFLYGRPVKWSQSSKGTDAAFEAFQSLVDKTRFNARMREAKRLAGAESQSALLFHVYQNDEGKADCLIKVLAKSLGDDIYFRKDQFDRLTAFARGYNLSEGVGRIVYHVDIYTKEKIYYCKRGNMGWDIDAQPNIVGKIPVLLCEQETECHGVEPMINRKEWMISVLADVNDRFSNPAMYATADIINSLPEKGEDSKLYILKQTADGKMPQIGYLTWDSASESKKNEGDELDYHILNKSFTPKIDFENMKSLSQMSGKALQQLMLLAKIKADMRKERHDDYISRVGNLYKAIIGNVLDIRLAGECKNLELIHEFQEPFGEDVASVIDNLIKSKNAGGLSEESLVEMNPIIKDPQLEKQRLKKEHDQYLQEQKDTYNRELFETAG
jgi:hypothetical protein